LARLFLMMVATVGFVLFALANTERVEFSFVFGQTQIRLIFLLVTSFATGALGASFVKTMRALARRRAHKQRIRVVMKRAALRRAEAE
jgi:uncharacterized integral membrane protein